MIEVQLSEDTPVRYKGVIWIRIGARKAEANTEEERILTEKGQIHSSSSMDVHAVRPPLRISISICSSRNICLKPSLLQHWQRINARRFNRWRHCVSLIHGFNCPTYAGILLLGYDPQYFIPGHISSM